MGEAVPSRWLHEPRADAWVIEMARRLDVPIPARDDPIFARLRHALVMPDDFADELASWVKQDRANRGRFDHLLDHPDEPEAERPAILQRLKDDLIDARPAWADPEKMRIGAEAHFRLGLLGRLANGTLGLLDGYRNAAVAKSLVATGSLATATKRRLAETTKFANDILSSDGMQRGSPGFNAAIRVRLVHSFVRHGLARNPQWRHDAWGMPITIMDSLGTALSFWVPAVLAAPVFGYTLSTREAEGMMTLWNYVGWLQGVPDELLPTTLHETYRIYLAVMMQMGDADADSYKLAQSFLAVAAGHGDETSWLQEKMVLGAAARLIPAAHRKELGIPNTMFRFWPDLMRRQVRRKDARCHRDPAAYAAAVKAGREETLAALPQDLRQSSSYDPSEVIRDHSALAA
jgi:hypothetical protein